MENLKPLRRSLSGIYIFDTLPGDTRRAPTCLEDCQPATRLRWLAAQAPECLEETIKIAFEKICRILADSNLTRFSVDQEQDRLIRENFLRTMQKRCTEYLASEGVVLLDSADRACRKLRQLGDMLNISA